MICKNKCVLWYEIAEISKWFSHLYIMACQLHLYLYDTESYKIRALITKTLKTKDLLKRKIALLIASGKLWIKCNNFCMLFHMTDIPRNKFLEFFFRFFTMALIIITRT